MRKSISYEVTYTDGSVDHVNKRKAEKLRKQKPKDIVRIEKLIQYGDDSGETERDYEDFYENKSK